MATINPTISFLGENTVSFTYAPMVSGDVGAPIGPNHSDYRDRNVSVLGTFGVGGTVVIEGSNNDGTNYHTLNDQSDNALSFATAKNEQIMQTPGLTRPHVTAGDGTTSLTVVITVSRVPLPRN